MDESIKVSKIYLQKIKIVYNISILSGKMYKMYKPFRAIKDPIAQNGGKCMAAGTDNGETKP
nr:hypothetical protein [uncultured Acetatifactor sp.]